MNMHYKSFLIYFLSIIHSGLELIFSYIKYLFIFLLQYSLYEKKNSYRFSYQKKKLIILFLEITF